MSKMLTAQAKVHGSNMTRYRQSLGTYLNSFSGRGSADELAIVADILGCYTSCAERGGNESERPRSTSLPHSGMRRALEAWRC